MSNEVYLLGQWYFNLFFTHF